MSLLGCQGLPYVIHLGAGQARLLLDRQRLTPALESQLTERERQGLEALRRASAFGDEIGLDRSTSYRHLVDRSGRPLVTVVTASPRDRLEVVTWWFPIVGRVPYRGYFDPDRARRFAESLEARDLDIYVRPAFAYSTLGWFDDPIPRALLSAEPIEVADTVLHERVHETIFVRGDVAYNEALALFLAHEAVMRLYTEDEASRTRAERAFTDERLFAGLLDRLAAELETLYAENRPRAELLESRKALFERYQTVKFKAIPWETERYSGFPAAPLSNAYIVARRTYLGDLPCLRAELATLDGDLTAFVRAHREGPGRRETENGACAFGEEPSLR